MFMDQPTTAPAPAQFKPYRWLPYWAVLQTDVRQTLRSWVYRLWLLVSIGAAAGYLLYRLGLYREAGLVQPAANLVGELLRWALFGSGALVVVLTVGAIASERGTLADSVLSRGISRYQYFLAKWHARLAVVLGTFLLLGGAVLGCSQCLLHDDLSLPGSLLALAVVAAVLAAVVSGGVSVGALTGSSLLGVALLWGLMYGGGLLMSLLPPSVPSPERLLARLPHVLRGHYDTQELTRFAAAAVGTGCAAAVVGMLGFVRKDV
jgi:ABC-2 type transport system permease protein